MGNVDNRFSTSRLLVYMVTRPFQLGLLYRVLTSFSPRLLGLLISEPIRGIPIPLSLTLC